MGDEISRAVVGCQQPSYLPLREPIISVASMTKPRAPRTEKKPSHQRVVTAADKAASARMKKIWQNLPVAMTQTEIAFQYGEGANQSLVSQYMNGKLALNYRAVVKFAAILGVRPEQIRDDLPEQRLAGRVSDEVADYDWEDVLGFAQSAGLGAGAEAQEYAETHNLKFRSESLRRKGLRPQNLVVYYGKGDSMEPRINNGDAILFDTSDVRPSDGSIFLVQRGKEIHAKRCEILDEVVYFRSDNPMGDHNWRKPRRLDSPRDPLIILGRVRWIGSWEN